MLDSRDFFSGIFVSTGGVIVELSGFVVPVVEAVVAVVAGAVSDSARNPSSSSILGTITLCWSSRVSCPVGNELLPEEVFSKERGAISTEGWNSCGG
jgi:hypothetical protein